MIPVTLEAVSKRYPGGAVAVDDLNLQIEAGEFFTLLGPSGCGKTTTLRMIAGFLQPSSGRILFGEQEVTQVPPNRRGTGMVFQNYALFPHLTVFENVAFGLKVRRLPRAEVQARVAEALAQVRLAGYEGRRIEQLSGGQQQRVALARALVIQPKLLLLDEPLSNLDAKLREETRAEIRRLQLASRTTAIYVTHDQAEALALSDRIAVLEGGRLHQVGTPAEIYHRPATPFVATFIGRSNLLRGEWDGAETLTLTAGPRLRVRPERRNAQVAAGLVTVALRPEGLRLARPGDEVNLLEGSVLSAEFGGGQVAYEVGVGPLRIRATVAAGEGELLGLGEPITLHVPPERLYLVE